VLQCVAVCCRYATRTLHKCCVAVCCSVLLLLLQCVAGMQLGCCTSVVSQETSDDQVSSRSAVCCSVLKRVAVCCSVVQCGAVCCSGLLCHKRPQMIKCLLVPGSA